MKNGILLYRIIEKKYKGNVSILIILVLVACSLMGILTMNFLNNLMEYTDDTYSYYKSYYIAKAGLELALTEINNTEVGFSQEIFEDTAINANNFSCIGCHFHSQVLGKSGIISNNFWQTSECNETTAFSLQKGDSITLPLFYDNSANFSQIFDGNEHVKNIATSLSDLKLIPVGTYLSSNLNIGVVFETGGTVLWDYLFMKGMPILQANNFFSQYVTDFNAYYNDGSIRLNNGLPYIVISNPNDFEVKFCIGNKENPIKVEYWPNTKYFISSRGEYNGRTIGLQAIYAQPIPSFFISPYSY